MIVNLEKLSDCLGVGYGIKDADLADVQTVQSKVKRPHWFSFMRESNIQQANLNLYTSIRLRNQISTTYPQE